MKDHVAKTVMVYDTIAKEYADAIENFAPEKERKKFLKAIPKGGKILDVGCAAGRDSFYFAEHGLKVTGIDLSEELLKIARTKGTHVDFQKQDMRNLTFSKSSFDGIWACASLLHLKRAEVPNVLKTFYKLLKPKRTLFILVKMGEGEADVAEDQSAGLPRHFTFFQKTEVKTLLEQAGFDLLNLYTWVERDRWPEKRDVTLIVSFSRKP